LELPGSANTLQSGSCTTFSLARTLLLFYCHLTRIQFFFQELIKIISRRWHLLGKGAEMMTTTFGHQLTTETYHQT
jgi:hypothetical protein